ncbi:MAG: dihydroorotate dehydrogenase [Thermoplasmata archaeon]
MDPYRILRPFFFALPADIVEEVSQWAFRRRAWTLLSLGRKPGIPMETSIAGIDLSNPFGLAAGFDKNGDITAAVASLGFGFVVLGSVRTTPHPGNPRPWFVRRLRDEGLVNAMGLPSKGSSHALGRLEDLHLQVPLLLSIVGESTSDIVQVYENLKGLVEGFELNLSCPNTETGRTFEEDLDAFEGLLKIFETVPGPIFLKLSPYETEEGRERALEMASRAIRRGMNSFTLCNTLPVEERGLGIGRGGLSGRPLFPLAVQAVRDFYEEWGERVNIVGVGGILKGKEAFQMLASGARAVEVLTGLILRGPLVVRKLMEELEVIMKERGFQSVEELVGSGVG